MPEASPTQGNNEYVRLLSDRPIGDLPSAVRCLRSEIPARPSSLGPSGQEGYNRGTGGSWLKERKRRMAVTHVIREDIEDCKSIGFDEHALTRMNDRNVTEDEVVEVLRSPDRTGLPTQPNRFRYRKTVSGRSVDVVFERDPTQIVVITVIA